jgi:hypothetical protein
MREERGKTRRPHRVVHLLDRRFQVIVLNKHGAVLGVTSVERVPDHGAISGGHHEGAG